MTVKPEDLTDAEISEVWRWASGTCLSDVNPDLMYDCGVARSQPYTGHELPEIYAARLRICGAINARKEKP